MAWWQLDSILTEQASYIEYYRTQEPVACPRCGQPLVPGPSAREDVLYCPWGHFEYPRDWDPDSMAGM